MAALEDKTDIREPETTGRDLCPRSRLLWCGESVGEIGEGEHPNKPSSIKGAVEAMETSRLEVINVVIAEGL